MRLNQAFRKISNIGDQLELPQYIAEAGQRFYKLAQEKNFIQGRHIEQIGAVCLYIACRKEKIPCLLIDFSDILKTNVYILGNYYLKLLQVLHLEVPLIDPSIFIYRFCSKLEFEDKTKQVVQTALKLL